MDNDNAAAASAAEFEGSARRLPFALARAMLVVSITYALFHLIVLNFWAIDEWVYRAAHVNFGGLIAILTLRGWKTESFRVPPLWDWFLAGAAIWCTVYIMWQLDGLIMRTGVITTTGDFITGALGALLVVEFARRVSGLILPVIALIFVTYVFTGQHMPGVLKHSGFQTDNFFSYIYSQEGVFGLTAAASSRYIILFVAFAVFLRHCGAGSYFMDLAMALFGWARGGAGKVSVASGLMFGTVSGSAVANVVASGTFTIPMMRRAGYSKTHSGAIEATSSSGGQLAPPVMGAGAFIMAEITGIPYSEIIVAALLPCLVFYFAVFVSVDRQAVRLGIEGLPRSELPKLREIGGDALLLLPLFVLLYLLFSGYSVIAAGTWGLASTLLVLIARTFALDSRWLAVPLVLFAVLPLFGFAVNFAGLMATLISAATLLGLGLSRRHSNAETSPFAYMGKAVVGGLSDTTKSSLQLIGVMACAGIVVGVLGLTGLGGRLSSLILAAAGESQPIAFLLAMIISIILGMGMPTTAAYAIAAAVVAPALQSLGIQPIAAHLFVFYCAVISAITPPVAIAAFAAAALSGGKPFTTSLIAMRLGIAAFILPFMFYTAPGILMQGSAFDIAWTFVGALFAVWLIAVAGEGRWIGIVGPVGRIAALIAALFLLYHSVATDLAGLAIASAIFASRWWGRRSPSSDIQPSSAIHKEET